jgi:hypothetical protein
LVLCGALLNKPATLMKVRDKLSGIAKPLKKAKAAMEAMSKVSSLANVEAYNRILLAEESTQPGYEVVAEQLTHIITIMQRALELLAAEPRRTNDANPIPIHLIEAALSIGFRKHHDPEMRGKVLPPYKLRVSRKRPPFPEIATICYEAIGRRYEPDRAIRNYLALTKSRKRRHNIKTVSRDQKSGELVETICSN